MVPRVSSPTTSADRMRSERREPPERDPRRTSAASPLGRSQTGSAATRNRIRAVRAAANAIAEASRCRRSRTKAGTRAGAQAASARRMTCAPPRPRRAPTPATQRPSVSCSHARPEAGAPSAVRTASSPRRASLRARKRPTMLASVRATSSAAATAIRVNGVSRRPTRKSERPRTFAVAICCPSSRRMDTVTRSRSAWVDWSETPARSRPNILIPKLESRSFQGRRSARAPRGR